MTKPRAIAETLAEAFAHVDAGRVGRARPLARALAKHRPQPPGLAYLEGLIALADGEPKKAARHLARALAATPDAPPLLLAMARAQAAQRRDAEAETFYRRLLALAPEAAAGQIELAALLVKRAMIRRDAGAPAEAAELFAEAVAVDPRSFHGNILLGRVREGMGERDAAVAAYRRALALDPEDRYGAATALARLGAGAAPDKASDLFLRGLFDEYAPKFEAELVGVLSYRAPALLADAIRAALGPGPFDVFDMGCGTGLMGEALLPMAKSLVGADFSPRMVERARARGAYDRLEVGDAVAMLAESPGAYDLVTAADVLVYTGDLAPVVAAARRALRAGGGFAFTVEGGADGDWKLQANGRYTHSKAYLRRLAKAGGFEMASLAESSTRTESGQPVPSLVCVLRKGA